MTPLSPTAVEAAAKAIAASYGEDPDDYASLLDICGPNNEPLLTWQKYEEQATAAITAYLEARRKEGFVEVPVSDIEEVRESMEQIDGTFDPETHDYLLYHRLEVLIRPEIAGFAAAQKGDEPCK